jgi:hypothetical protein
VGFELKRRDRARAKERRAWRRYLEWQERQRFARSSSPPGLVGEFEREMKAAMRMMDRSLSIVMYGPQKPEGLTREMHMRWELSR